MNFTAHGLLFEEMISEEAIRQRVQELGAALTADYEGKNPLFIGILNGAFIFAADLLRACDMACEVDFVRISSYVGLESTGEIQLVMELKSEIQHRHLILVEDIVDSGKTLHFFIKQLQKRNPASIAIASLLLKPAALQHSLDVKYCGFEIPNQFVIGYGLDYNDQGRQLRGIYQLVEQG